MLVDWEIHATAYRGQDERMTVAGIVARCAELGLTHIGVMDHLAPERGWPAEGLKKVFADFEGLQVPSGMRVYRGAEVDITEGGCMPNLADLREELGLDYIVGSVHVGRREGANSEDYVRRQFGLMMQVLKEPQAPSEVEGPQTPSEVEGPSPIDILGHPWGGRLVGQVPEGMLRELLRALATAGVGVEVSPRFGAEEADIELLVKAALEEGAKLAPASDAHAYEHLGDTAGLQPVLTAAHAQPDDLWLPRST